MSSVEGTQGPSGASSAPRFRATAVVASSAGHRVLFAAFEKHVEIRDLASGARSDILETTFDFGGRRLALSDPLDGVLAAAYHVSGVAFYSASLQREVWRRKDLKKIQCVTLSRDGLTGYCGFVASALVALDLRTGETTYSLRGARELHESPYDAVHFVDATHPCVVDSRGVRRFVVERTTFAFLGVAFAPGLLLLSESGGPLRCLDVSSGRERWRHTSAPDSHVLNLAHDESDGDIVAVEFRYESDGAKRLLRLRASDGEVLFARDLGRPRACCFAMAGRVLVTTDGDVIPTGGPVDDRR